MSQDNEQIPNDTKYDYSKLYERMEYTDVIFSIYDKEIKAHKCVLSAKSEYFEKMFASPMKGHEEKNIIKLDNNINSNSFNQFIKFLYTNDIVVDQTNFIDLVCLSDMYCLISLQNILLVNFDIVFGNNVDAFLDVLPLFKDIEFIKAKCATYIINSWGIIKSEEGFYNIVMKDASFFKFICQCINMNENINITNPKVLDEDGERILKELSIIAKKNEEVPTVNMLKEVYKQKDILFNHADNIRLLCNKLNIKIPEWFAKKYKKYFVS